MRNIFIIRRAQRELAELPTEVYVRIRDAIRDLGKEPRPRVCGKLTGATGMVYSSGRIPCHLRDR